MRVKYDSNVKEILVISLSNIGDVILTFPVLDILKKDFPLANLSVVIGPKAKSLLKGNPFIDNLYIFNKTQSLLQNFHWILALRKTYFDLIVDLRNTAIPLMLPHRHRTTLFKTRGVGIHMKDKHLKRLKSVYDYSQETLDHDLLFVSTGDKMFVHQLIEKDLNGGQDFILVSPGAANHDKRWTAEGFRDICQHFSEKHNLGIVFAGDENDQKVIDDISSKINCKFASLCGKISLIQLSYLIKISRLVFSNDSAPMHLASYLNIPVVSVFGPTNPLNYGPWGARGAYVKDNIACSRCENPKSEKKHSCMEVSSHKVISAAEKLLLP